MQFSSNIVYYTAAFGLMATASPLVAVVGSSDSLANGRYVEVMREPSTVANGTLVYYGLSQEAIANQRMTDVAEKAQEWCPNGQNADVTCDRDNAARNEFCQHLLSDLRNNAGAPVNVDIRQLCWYGTTRDDDKCCASWHEKISGLHKSDISGGAGHIFDICNANGISGKIGSMNLNGKCSALCLSNRGTFC